MNKLNYAVYILCLYLMIASALVSCEPANIKGLRQLYDQPAIHLGRSNPKIGRSNSKVGGLENKSRKTAFTNLEKRGPQMFHEGAARGKGWDKQRAYLGMPGASFDFLVGSNAQTV